MVLAASLALAACGDRAGAQTSASTREQIRQRMGDAPARIDTTTATRLSAAFRGAAEQALPAVVRVSVTTVARPIATSQGPRGFPFPLPFSPNDDDTPPQGGRGTGSGFVIDNRGYIMTNNHVIEDADRVIVSMVDGREYPATVVGGDPQTDVGVIKIEPRKDEPVTPVAFGSSDDLHVGDWVIALGNPLNLQFTVTAGIVSAKGRNLNILNNPNGTSLESYIQTDAVINPGNSGGPMVDLTGKVVGINSAIESMTGVWAGNGFAIPIDLARKVATDIIEYGHVRRPRLGVGVGTIRSADAEVFRLPSVSGALINSVQPGTPAEAAGIQMGDVVVQLNDMQIRTQSEFMEELARLRPGDNARLSIIRYGQRLNKTVKLGEFQTTMTDRRRGTQRPASNNMLGFSVQALTPEIAQQLRTNIRSGVFINSVDPLSAAIEAFGTPRPGFVLRKINGQEVSTVQDVERAASRLRSGQTVTLIVRGPESDYDTILNYRVR